MTKRYLDMLVRKSLREQEQLKNLHNFPYLIETPLEDLIEELKKSDQLLLKLRFQKEKEHALKHALKELSNFKNH